ncbi:MAG TPA: VPLPA-CTERM sorting domain-containing protein [Paracoccaceae bacterium]|nr:VPLPA-CTERM sorting domain-containing protein [Paracoccaceae bacterium]
MIAKSLLIAGVIALSAGSAGAVSYNFGAATYYADQGATASGGTVDPDRSILANASDGKADTWFSLGIGGTLSIDVKPHGLTGGQVTEVTFKTVNDAYLESAQIWLGGQVDANGVFDQTGAYHFGTLINDETGFELEPGSFGSITKLAQGGNTTVWELLFTGDTEYSLITLLDITNDNNSPLNDGFDVGEFKVTMAPLPASVLMLMGALCGLGFIGRRRRADA